MFAPTGFISLKEVFERLADEADNWRLSTPNRDDPNPGGEYEEGSFSLVDVNYARALSYTHWLFQCFLNRNESELYAAISNGEVMKLSRHMVHRFKFYDGPFNDTKPGWDSIIEHVADPFTFISPVGYVISIGQARRWLDSDVVEEVAATLKMIDACPVCWRLPSKSPPIDWARACGVAKEYGSSGDLSPVSVKKRILRLKEENPSLTRDEVKEVVAPTISFRQYKLAWAMAVQENPTLAAPGRKSR